MGDATLHSGMVKREGRQRKHGKRALSVQKIVGGVYLSATGP